MRQAADIVFRWNGREVQARHGDSVAAALWRAGVTTLARSRKRHSPLGYSGCYPSGVLARVNGRPNVRLDLELADAGSDITMQNTWPSPRFDVLRAAQLLPAKSLYGGFEHGALIPSSAIGFRLAERMMAHLAGVALPASHRLQRQVIPGRDVEADLLVVGGGPAGIAAANTRAALGERVALVTRGAALGRFARGMGSSVPSLDPRVQLFASLELFGSYREGSLMVGAPHDHETGAVVFRPRATILATGRRSVPPLVKGNALPGVLDAHASIDLAYANGILPGSRIAVVGTGAESGLAQRLEQFGASVVFVGAAAALEEICGHRRVTGIWAGRHVACDALVHAGPWRTDPSLGFQVSADGLYQMQSHGLPSTVSLAGVVASGDEAIPVRRHVHPGALICPCMDVTVGEIDRHADAGETDPEVLKRLTSCGMGTCQGFPCWDSMIARLAARTGSSPDAFARPTHRPPRRAITVAQAAGLASIVQPDI